MAHLEIGMLVRLRPDWKPSGIREFRDCIGVVLGHPELGWPEWDVRWEPSGLRYAYPEEALEPAKSPQNRIPCKICRGSGFVAQKHFIDDGYGEVDTCKACQ